MHGNVNTVDPGIEASSQNLPNMDSAPPPPVLLVNKAPVNTEATPRLAILPAAKSVIMGSDSKSSSIAHVPQQSVDLVRYWELLQVTTLNMAEDLQAFLTASSIESSQYQPIDSSAPQTVPHSSDLPLLDASSGLQSELQCALDKMRTAFCQLSTLPRWRLGRDCDHDNSPSVAASIGQTSDTLCETKGGSDDEEAEPVSLMYMPPVSEQECRDGASTLLMAQVGAFMADLTKTTSFVTMFDFTFPSIP